MLSDYRNLLCKIKSYNETGLFHHHDRQVCACVCPHLDIGTRGTASWGATWMSTFDSAHACVQLWSKVWREISERPNSWDPEKENMQGNRCLRPRLRRARGRRGVGVSKPPMHTNRFPREPAIVNKDSNFFFIWFFIFYAKRPLVQTMYKSLWQETGDRKKVWTKKRESTGKEVT